MAGRRSSRGLTDALAEETQCLAAEACGPAARLSRWAPTLANQNQQAAPSLSFIPTIAVSAPSHDRFPAVAPSAQSCQKLFPPSVESAKSRDSAPPACRLCMTFPA
jgi:hypothetical protein